MRRLRRAAPSDSLRLAMRLIRKTNSASHTPRFPIGAWLLYAGLSVLTGVVALQDTRYSIIPAPRTPALWSCTIGTLCGVLILRLGWWGWTQRGGAQDALGTLSNSFYEPRRQAIAEGTAVFGGVMGGLWWGIISWVELLNGIRRGSATHGLLNLQLAVVVGVITGAVAGAVAGRVAGALWEGGHRRRRLSRSG
jgi:hypothetical protein